METADYSDINLPIGRLWAHLAKAYYGALTKKLDKIKLDRHYSVMILIHQQKDKCSQQFLANYLHIDKVYMVKIIDNLSKKGLVKRNKNPEDRREHIIELTPKGKKLIPEILLSVKQMNKAAFSGFSEKETAKFLVGLIQVLGNLKSLPSNKVTLNFKKGK